MTAPRFATWCQSQTEFHDATSSIQAESLHSLWYSQELYPGITIADAVPIKADTPLDASKARHCWKLDRY